MMDEKGKIKLTAEDMKTYLDSCCSEIMKIKQIKPELHRQFVTSITMCIRQIIGYKQLVHEVEIMRSEAFNENNLDHEMSLLQIWTLLQPDTPLHKRVTKQWQTIGFQGEDPKTDFRGMGMLGLSNLVYFAKEFSSAARHILSHSHHPQLGYSFAIVGINLTHMAYKLLMDSSLKSHMFNINLHKPTIENFWLECKPKDIMEFNRIRDLFENNIRSQLADPRTCFKVNIQVDTV